MEGSLWASAITAYLHYLSFMLSFGALAIEGLTLKPDLSLKEAWRVLIADGVYGIAATGVLATGILRVLYFDQGKAFYLSNPVFYAKVAIFLVVGTLSLYPTVSFLRWIKALRAGEVPSLEQPQVNRLLWLIRIELVGFAMIPLLAALMARGIGLPVA